MRCDIIPDIHGHATKLEARLRKLGYREASGAWRHSDPRTTALFLGDFIDRGPENAKVIDIVRRMIDAGTAKAVMGNHELNAIRFHSYDPVTCKYCRPHTPKNRDQHASFLREYPRDDARRRDVISWMATLPLFLEEKGFRAVHACWDQSMISAVRKIASDGVLNADLHVEVARETHVLHAAVETITKGPEARLPKGLSFRGRGGLAHAEIRLQWWKRSAKTWRDIAISVPDLTEVPDTSLPPGILQAVYPVDAPSVFFGHYWLSGAATLQSHNTLCLDYSAGEDGPLVAYRMEDPKAPLELVNMALD